MRFASGPCVSLAVMGIVLAGCGVGTVISSDSGVADAPDVATDGAVDVRIDAVGDVVTMSDAPVDAITGPVCTVVGDVCGAQGVQGGDANTLYVCTTVGAAPVSQQQCDNGCISATQSTSAECVVVMMPPPASPVCPGLGYWCGEDMVTNGVAGTLYDCPGAGAAPSSMQVCGHGCQVEPMGTPDFCASGGPMCPGVGAWCGADGVGGDDATLYQCASAGSAPTSSMVCANGCHVEPAGTPDLCRPSQSCPGVGDYCGSDGVAGGNGNTLYHCPGAGMPPSGSTGCAHGCQIEPAGVPDVCANTSPCPGPGDYCGNDGLNGAAGILYHCNAGGQAPASNTACASGCIVQAAGTPDVCAGGGCSAAGNGSRSWEANQLHSGLSWSDECLGFVSHAYSAAGDWHSWLAGATAADSLASARATGAFHSWDGSCPCGAVLYWAGNSCNGEDGHVVICNGDGTASTSGWPGFAGSTDASITWLDGEECGHTPSGWILP